MTTDNTIGFCSFVDGGVRYYGCRGHGKDYDDFYRWIHSTSYKCTSEDFPWDHFVFTNINDEQIFLSKYSKLIDFQTE